MDPLLETKLAVPPARSVVVPRPLLLERQQAGLSGPLTLVSAPAGSGKTTLLSAWRASPEGQEQALAWVALDAGDNDAVRFWRYVLTALRSSDLRFSAEETAAFLGTVMAVALAPDEMAALVARTEGWIAGLLLAGLSLQGRSIDDTAAFIAAFAGSHRYIVDFLLDEVLLRQPGRYSASCCTPVFSPGCLRPSAPWFSMERIPPPSASRPARRRSSGWSATTCS